MPSLWNLPHGLPAYLPPQPTMANTHFHLRLHTAEIFPQHLALTWQHLLYMASFAGPARRARIMRQVARTICSPASNACITCMRSLTCCPHAPPRSPPSGITSCPHLRDGPCNNSICAEILDTRNETSQHTMASKHSLWPWRSWLKSQQCLQHRHVTHDDLSRPTCARALPTEYWPQQPALGLSRA